MKHQVFVSSTYKDLIEERKSIIHALLELDCIPAGMELFPATDEDAWTLIKDVIDCSDYYILIIAGKYGSVNEDGISYTEMEFDYAASVGKPMIIFVHENIETLSSANSEKTELLQNKLKSFREKATAKHCKFWKGTDDLGGKVSRSLVQLKKRHPSAGWVQGKYAATDAMRQEILELKSRIAEFELAAALVDSNKGPDGVAHLAQGSDMEFNSIRVIQDEKGTKKLQSIGVSWDKIFCYCGPSMVNECTDEELKENLKLMYLHSLPKDVLKFNTRADLVLPIVVVDAIKIQLQALGLIAPGTKKRQVSDIRNYWTLTPYGKKYLLNISAAKKVQD